MTRCNVCNALRPDDDAVSRTTDEGASILVCKACLPYFDRIAKTAKESAPSVLEEAAKLVAGDRQESYGSYPQEAEKVAAGWSKLLDFEVPARKVPLMMSWLKLVREAHRHKRDNLTDICGYAKLAQDIAESNK